MNRRANGEGTIKKREDGYYAVALSQGTDASGKRIRHQTTCKTQKEARAKLDSWKAAMRGGIDLKKENMTVSALIDLWLENCSGQLKETTMFSYRQQCRLHLTPMLGALKVSKVDGRTLDAFFTEKRNAGLSATSIAYLRRLLHAIFEQAMDYDIVMRNVVERTAAIKVTKYKAKSLTAVEVERLAAVLPDDAYGLFGLVCISLGMRPAEVSGLRWCDIKANPVGWVEGWHVKVVQQIKPKRGQGGGYTITTPKTDSGQRSIPLPKIVADKIWEFKKRQDADHARADAEGLSELYPLEWRGFVFTGQAGIPLSDRYIRRKFKEFLAIAGLDQTMRLYDARHTFNSTLLDEGVNNVVRQGLMGHANTYLVDNDYAHAMPSANFAAMEVMNRVLSPK